MFQISTPMRRKEKNEGDLSSNINEHEGKTTRMHTCVNDISPYKARASVLGIGVADMARTCGAICFSPLEISSELVASILELMEV